MPEDQPAGAPRGELPPVVVLDVANVVGSRPDGWWKDRAGAAGRLMAGAAGPLAAGSALAVVAVLEGRARTAAVPPVAGLEVVLAPADGDAAIAEVAHRLAAARPGAALVVVTADRGLRERLPPGARAEGPRWWTALVDATGDGADRAGGRV